MKFRELLRDIVRESFDENSKTKNLILYHGTRKNFNFFDLNFFNSGSGDGGWLGYGIYLTNDYEYAESYGDVLECEVKLNNPYVLTDYLYSIRPEKLNDELGTHNGKQTTKKLTEMGYDSTMLKYSDEDRSWLDYFIEVCVFNPANVKILKRYEQGDDSLEVKIKRGYSL